MKRLAALVALVAFVLLPLGAHAAPVDPALQKQLVGIFEQFNAVFGKGDFARALALRSARVQQQAREDLKTAQDQLELVQMVRMMTPDSVEVLHAKMSRDGNQVTLVTLARKKMPADPAGGKAPGAGSVRQNELILDFVKEEGAWKYDNQTFGIDPNSVKPCQDSRYEPFEAYDEGSDLALGGPIRRVQFAADYTLVVVRVQDEEICVFLPNRAALDKAGVKTELLAPYTIVGIDGYKHKTVPQKVWAKEINIDSDD